MLLVVAALARRAFLLQRADRLAFLLDLRGGVVDIGVWYVAVRVVGEPAGGGVAPSRSAGVKPVFSVKVSSDSVRPLAGSNCTRLHLFHSYENVLT
mgnify:CR=1 FL=1